MHDHINLCHLLLSTNDTNDTSLPCYTEPTTLKEAISNLTWFNNMQIEHNALLRTTLGILLTSHMMLKLLVINGCTWTNSMLMEFPSSQSQVSCKGFPLEWGFWLQQDFQSMIKFDIVYIVLTQAIFSKWPILQIDIKNTFLHGDLEETVYMH